jgi:hypothetical protein
MNKRQAYSTFLFLFILYLGRLSLRSKPLSLFRCVNGVNEEKEER